MAAGLANDTGVSNADTVAFDPTISGQATDATVIVSFRAGLDTALPGAFTVTHRNGSTEVHSLTLGNNLTLSILAGAGIQAHNEASIAGIIDANAETSRRQDRKWSSQATAREFSRATKRR